MTNRGVLFSSVQTWMKRDDTEFVAQLPTFLLNVESRIATEITHASMEVTGTLTVTGRSGALPSDLLSFRSITPQGDCRQLDRVTPEIIREGVSWNATGIPRRFSVEGRNIVLAPPASDTGTVFDIVYFTRFAPLTSDASTNFILTNHFPVYLYAMLVEACVFTEDTRRAVTMEEKYKQAKDSLATLDTTYKTGGATYIVNNSIRD